MSFSSFLSSSSSFSVRIGGFVSLGRLEMLQDRKIVLVYC